jgi:hypothetical protein
MASAAVALITLAATVAAGLWLALRATALAELDLPARWRRRALWWQSHHTPVYVGCAVLATAAGLTQLAPLF